MCTVQPTAWAALSCGDRMEAIWEYHQHTCGDPKHCERQCHKARYCSPARARILAQSRCDVALATQEDTGLSRVAGREAETRSDSVKAIKDSVNNNPQIACKSKSSKQSQEEKLTNCIDERTLNGFKVKQRVRENTLSRIHLNMLYEKGKTIMLNSVEIKIVRTRGESFIRGVYPSYRIIRHRRWVMDWFQQLELVLRGKSKIMVKHQIGCFARVQENLLFTISLW